MQGEEKVVVFLSTERYMFCVLSWDTEKGARRASADAECKHRLTRSVKHEQSPIAQWLQQLVVLKHGLGWCHAR